MQEEHIKHAIITEAHRIEEDSLHSMKGHFNAGALWAKVHLILGIPSVVLAAWAGLEAFADNPAWTATLALLSASLTATITFLHPQQTADNYKNAGREYNRLKNQSRRFREIEVLAAGDQSLVNRLTELAKQRDELNSSSPDIPRWAYEKAKKDIDTGRATYRVDKREGGNVGQ